MSGPGAGPGRRRPATRTPEGRPGKDGKGGSDGSAVPADLRLVPPALAAWGTAAVLLGASPAWSAAL
ncbi:hypothetical protein, partial [Streptomyces sp. NPDC004599]